MRWKQNCKEGVLWEILLIGEVQKQGMFMPLYCCMLTIIANAYLSLIILMIITVGIPQEYINSIQSYMLINIV